jgi:hypothetical protein
VRPRPLVLTCQSEWCGPRSRCRAVSRREVILTPPPPPPPYPSLFLSLQLAHQFRIHFTSRDPACSPLARRFASSQSSSLPPPARHEDSPPTESGVGVGTPHMRS